MQPLILVVEDDQEVCDMIQTLLESQGFRVATTGEASRALKMIQQEPPAILILDWYLPKLSGIDFLKVLRADSQTQMLPVILISAKATLVQDAVIALESGADDYLIKPFDPRLLLARVQALLRRRFWSGRNEKVHETLQVGKIEIRPYERVALVGGKPLSLTRLEFELLAFFVRSPNRALSRRELLEAIWKYPDDAETRTVDKHVETLRKKLGPAAKHIQTVPTVGYRLIPEE